MSFPSIEVRRCGGDTGAGQRGADAHQGLAGSRARCAESVLAGQPCELEWRCSTSVVQTPHIPPNYKLTKKVKKNYFKTDEAHNEQVRCSP